MKQIKDDHAAGYNSGDKIKTMGIPDMLVPRPDHGYTGYASVKTIGYVT